MRTTRRRITQSTGARAAAGCAFLVAIALLIPGVTQRFNTAVQWRPSGPFFSPGQVKFDHSANATTEESPPEEAAAAEAAAAQEGGQEVAPVEPIDLAALNEDQLFEALMWWQSSQKIDSAPIAHFSVCHPVSRMLTACCILQCNCIACSSTSRATDSAGVSIEVADHAHMPWASGGFVCLRVHLSVSSGGRVRAAPCVSSSQTLPEIRCTCPRSARATSHGSRTSGASTTSACRFARRVAHILRAQHLGAHRGRTLCSS